MVNTSRHVDIPVVVSFQKNKAFSFTLWLWIYFQRIFGGGNCSILSANYRLWISGYSVTQVEINYELKMINNQNIITAVTQTIVNNYPWCILVNRKCLIHHKKTLIGSKYWSTVQGNHKKYTALLTPRASGAVKIFYSEACELAPVSLSWWCQIVCWCLHVWHFLYQKRYYFVTFWF